MNKHITREHKLIRQARLAKGLSQQQVATLINIQIRQYQRLEYGESDVQKLGMRAGLSLCIVLELDPYDLIFGANPKALYNLKNCPPVKRGRPYADRPGNCIETPAKRGRPVASEPDRCLDTSER